MHRLWICALLVLAPTAGADLSGHPLAAPGSSLSLAPDPGFLQWGPTTLGYSTAWSGGQNYSQGFLLKQVSAELLPGLNFQAQFGFSYQPGMQVSGDNGARLEIPAAMLTWQPSENFVMRLQWQQGGLANDLFRQDPLLMDRNAMFDESTYQMFHKY